MGQVLNACRGRTRRNEETLRDPIFERSPRNLSIRNTRPTKHVFCSSYNEDDLDLPASPTKLVSRSSCFAQPTDDVSRSLPWRHLDFTSQEFQEEMKRELDKQGRQIEAIESRVDRANAVGRFSRTKTVYNEGPKEEYAPSSHVVEVCKPFLKGGNSVDQETHVTPDKESEGAYKIPQQEPELESCGIPGPQPGAGDLVTTTEDNSTKDTSISCSIVMTGEDNIFKIGESVKLFCPRGAVDSHLNVTVQSENPSKYYGLIALKDLENDVMFAAPVISLEPSGHLFKKPLTLTSKITVNFRSDDVLVLHGSKAREGTITWQDVNHKSRIDEPNAEVSIEIEHFSLIAVLLRLGRSTLLCTKDIVSRLNLLAFNYTLSVLLNKSSLSSVHDELALLFVSQDVYHEQFYREDETSSALVQLKKEGFAELHVRSIASEEERSIYNKETLQVKIRLGGDYKLANKEQESIFFTVLSYDWWHEGTVMRIPLEWKTDVRSLCGKVSVTGEYGHTSERHFNEGELCSYVRSLLGVEGAIFNVIPIAQLLGTPEESINQISKSYKDDDEHLDIILEHWSRGIDLADNLAALRQIVESLKEKDYSYRVSQRGQMYIRYMRNVARKISGLRGMNVDRLNYFVRKIQTLCKSVFRDCCIEMESSTDGVERAASLSNHAEYLIQSMETLRPLPKDIAKKYEQVCTSLQESIIKTFLVIVPFLIQNIKDIFIEESTSEVPLNGLRGLSQDKLAHFASDVRSAEGNINLRQLICESCNILEQLCMENYNNQPNTEIEKWGESLSILPMLNFLKPFFQHCPRDIRLHKRLDLFSCRVKNIMVDGEHIDEISVHDLSDVLLSLIHFAKFEPSKLVTFELNDSENHPLLCSREEVKYDRFENTYSQLFRIKNGSNDELHLLAFARVYVSGDIFIKGTFQSTITLTATGEKALNRYITGIHDVIVTKVEDEDSRNCGVVFCSTKKQTLLELLEVLRKELKEYVVGFNKSEVVQCPLSVQSVTSKADAVLSLRLVYKWGSEGVMLDSKDFETCANSFHAQLLGLKREAILLEEQPSLAVDWPLEAGSPGREITNNFPPGYIQIYITMMDERTITIVVNPCDCIRDVKETIHQMCQCPPSQQRIVFAGKKLEDDCTLSDYNVQNESTLHLVKRLRDVAWSPHKEADGKEALKY